jgi:hypothetical protein
LHGLDPKRVVFYTAPIANRDYAPPGSGVSGKVLLDAAKGAVLYRSVIDDRPTASRPSGTSTTTSGAGTSSTAPKPNLDAAQKTCRL